ncbi:GNAT family N-acetyltransferase [Halorubellus sp. PRR65]|uniref:GNAT family N-acetyltransferase n=1 Tax=Halorubellus sp. PRR65 TaxID=3098148 RepID=UPI002B26364A|nr:GNAT family N-acetyltransferase [Halorubellus sp. PRR65]
MRIEPARARDVEALADAWVALAAEQRAHGSHLEAAANRERIRESMAHHVVEESCLVARRADASDGDGSGGDDGFVGFVTFSVDGGGYELDATRGTVENLFVRAGSRGAGVGASLLSAAEDALAARGVDVVSLEVLARNGRAREFYDREGYVEQRVVVEKRVDVETDTKGNLGE